MIARPLLLAPVLAYGGLVPFVWMAREDTPYSHWREKASSQSGFLTNEASIKANSDPTMGLKFRKSITCSLLSGYMIILQYDPLLNRSPYGGVCPKKRHLLSIFWTFSGFRERSLTIDTG